MDEQKKPQVLDAEIIVIGQNVWGRGALLQEALDNADRPKHYRAFLVPKGTEVHGVDGSLVYNTNAFKPVVIAEKLPRRKS